MTHVQTAIKALEDALSERGVTVKKVEESEWFIGLEYHRKGLAMAVVGQMEGMAFDRLACKGWSDREWHSLQNLVRAHCAAYYA